MKEAKIIPQVIFGKEDLLCKKQLTSFLLQQQVEFVPDEHKFGSYQAFVKINDLPTNTRQSRYITPQKQQNLGTQDNKSTNIKNIPLSVKTEKLQSVNPKSPIQKTVKKEILPQEYLQTQNDVLEDDQVTRKIIQQKIELCKSAEVFCQQKTIKPEKLKNILEEIKSKIKLIDDVLIIYCYIKTNVYKNLKGQQIHKMCMSLFMIVLYFHYLGNQSDFQQEFNQLIHKLNDEQKGLKMDFFILVRLFFIIFIQTLENLNEKEMNKHTYQLFITATEQINTQKLNHNVLLLCVLFMDNPPFKAKLNNLMSSPKKQKNQNLITFGSTLESKSAKEDELPVKIKIFSVSKTPPRSKITSNVSKPIKEKEKIIKSSTTSKDILLNKSLNQNGVFADNFLRINTEKIEEKNYFRDQPTEKKVKGVSPKSATPSPNQSNYALRSLQPVNINKDEEFKTPIQQIHDTFRPHNFDSRQDYTSISQQPDRSIKDLNQVFNKIINEQFHKNHGSWFKKLHINPKYQMSPDRFEQSYRQILNKLLQDRVELMSSKELMIYYAYIVRKAKSLYMQFLRERGVKLKHDEQLQ